jgi:hypothetical protein
MDDGGMPRDVKKECGGFAFFDAALAFSNRKRVGNLWRKQVRREKIVNRMAILIPKANGPS